MRLPVVAGVGGGVGTTTVAVALRGHDAGRVAGTCPDILVCRATLDSLRRTAVVLDGAGPEPPPVLAVTLAARVPRRPLRAQLDLLEADAAALVLLPNVPRWCALVDPLAEAAQLLVEPAAQLPRPLRAYAAALRDLVTAVAATGRLGNDTTDGFARPPAFPDERHARRIGSDERHIRRESHGPPGPAAEPVRPTTAGAFRPVGGTAQRGAGPAGLLPAAPAPRSRPAPAAADPGHRAGIRIVAPTEARAASGREPGATAPRPPGARGADVAAGSAG
jgi:hypothetical protein